MSKEFIYIAHGCQQQALKVIGSRVAVNLLFELYDTAPGFYLSNGTLADRLNCSTRTVGRALAHLVALGLVSHDVTRSYSGARRTMCLTPESEQWILKGIVPAHLAGEV